MGRRNVAIILAGGSGHRFGAPLPKQFLKVGGQTILEYTIEAFVQNVGIDEVAVVLHPDYLSWFAGMKAGHPDWQKVARALPGGTERSDSSLAAIRAYHGQEVNLILHDGVRPFVSQRIIDEVVAALQEHEAVTVAVPVTDTIYEAENGWVHRIPDRARLMRAQTPQAFRVELITRAFDEGMKDAGFRVTDDCSVVEHYLHHPVCIVQGEESNVKLTFRDDLALVNQLIVSQQTTGMKQ